ncbi:tyrosine-type recombinase/integrase, partial [Salmonella enterica]|uniref:tyrosine-type recombinase/integrase n=4 Tax=Pseudomonadota TaxID=1224 RepID=UPI003CE6EEF8
LNPASVNAILERCAQAAGLGYVPQLSSHSLRRGMATSAYRSGADFRDIKRQGGWRHDGTVQGYIEEAGLFEENAAGSLLRSGRT